ncbi:ATP-binding protein [Rugosimonospora africana]|uniref:Tetratricopeptide repeat-containing protein n=1 Tax=Rugosimonospora africana TaxID=556532 RepID=A0A8J3VW73_9ACTN|nr:tetratricopeptide repeat protein [Rugosimonospora africana]GIH20443.1 hypothetical protein Raf01_86150 [Rugosimonospora africana]
MRFSLPPDTIAFIGRTKELAAITHTVTTAAEHGGVVAIHAIDGMPGVGKTTLAVHAAHQLTQRYPDRQLFLDLKAHTAGHQPTDPADLLRADGIDPKQLPDRLDARIALWRDRMAGRQALLVLDNVASTAQVVPLLPSSPHVLVLITSRRRLGDLHHAVHLHLKVLPHADAVAMFLRLVPRAANELEAVATLVQACEYLPLAIAITARRFAAHDTWTMTDLLAEVKTSRRRLLTLTSEDTTVQAAFDRSYRHLPPQRQRFFRLIGLAPGVDTDSYAAAARAGTSLDDAMNQLDRLYHDHLLEETSPHRYRMHDLVRTYARTLTKPQDGPDQAFDRLLDYYRHTAAVAMDTAYPHEREHRPRVPPSRTPSPTPPNPAAALGWLDNELPNLLAATKSATDHSRQAHLLHLSTILHRHLHTRGRFHDAETLHQQALSAARATGDQTAELNALTGLGHTHRLQGRHEQATDHYQQALRLAHASGHRPGELLALTGLANSHRMQGRYQQAADHYQRVLDMARQIGHRNWQYEAWQGLGRLQHTNGNPQAALTHHQQALALATDLGQPDDQARAHDGLAHAHLAMHQPEQARTHWQHALDILTRLGVDQAEETTPRPSATTSPTPRTTSEPLRKNGSQAP